jgi:replicative DNA helicase
MQRVHAAGNRPDVVGMGIEFGNDHDWLMRLTRLHGCSHLPGLPGHVRAVQQAAARRRVGSIAEEILDRVRAAADPGEIVDDAARAFATVELPAEEPRGLVRAADFAAAERPETPWVVPGLLRQGWRVMFVAGEGVGKSVLTNQVAVCAARGVHPFTGEEIPRRRSLIVDLENPDDVVAGRMRRLEVPDDAECWVWHREEGVDLRRRSDRAQFETILANVRPELVSIGPLYKTFRRRAGEQYDEAAADVQDVLDKLRSRFGFALMLEHHAPHGGGVGPRDLRPEGSSLWRRWPELGFTLDKENPDDRRVIVRAGFREDRVTHTWPERLRWGRGMPWVAA